MRETFISRWYEEGYDALADGQQPRLRSRIAWFILYKTPLGRWL